MAASDSERLAALAALRASASLVDGRLVPAWSAVSRATGVPRVTLTRWWTAERDATSEPPSTGELLERAADVARDEVVVEMRRWIRGPLAAWRRMVESATSETTIRRVDRLLETDPEAGMRAIGMLGKIIEAAPVISRLGDDDGPRGGTGRLDEVRRLLDGHSSGRMLISGQ